MINKIKPEIIIELPLKLEPQIESRLCWSAVTVSITNFYKQRKIKSQKDLAIKVFELDNYNHVYCPEKALKSVDHFKSYLERPLQKNEIYSELKEGRPIAACMRYFIGWHLVIIYGMTNLEELLIADSLHGNSTVPIIEFSNSYLGDYSWTHSYLTQNF